MMMSGLNESYQLMLIGVSAGVSMVVTVVACRKVYSLRIGKLSRELARCRQSLAMANELLEHSSQRPVEILRRSSRAQRERHSGFEVTTSWMDEPTSTTANHDLH